MSAAESQVLVGAAAAAAPVGDFVIVAHACTTSAAAAWLRRMTSANCSCGAVMVYPFRSAGQFVTDPVVRAPCRGGVVLIQP